MILVDSSVWIDYFRGVSTAETDELDRLLGKEPVAVGDLIVAEVLQGFDRVRDVDLALRLFGSLEIIEIGGYEIAVKAAHHFRTLRAIGITVRKTIDTFIATRCIVNNLSLLYSDRDFEPFVVHLGLRTAN